MQALIRQLKKCKYLVFFDLEGTQFTHEMIAIGSLVVPIDAEGNIIGEAEEFKRYVFCQGGIGEYVRQLTGISKKMLRENGISFSDTLKEWKESLGDKFSSCLFVSFGNHDYRILSQSLQFNPLADRSITDYIFSHCLDFSAFLAQYIKDEKMNPYSLLNYLHVFHQTPVPNEHDPLVDSKNLLLLYQAFLQHPEIVKEEYQKILAHMRHFPEPVREAIQRLLQGKNVTSKQFQKWVENYLTK